MSGLKSGEKEIKNFLGDIFNFQNSSFSKTIFFKGKKHEDLLEVFSAWFRLTAQLRGIAINNLNIQGIHDRGIDLIQELSGSINARIGIQIKCDNDFDKNLNIQVDKTLANYDTFNIDYVIFVFCGDYNNKSHKTKIRQEIARIQQKRGAGKFFIVEGPKALSIFEYFMPIPVYLEQFKATGIKKDFSFRVTGFEEHDSGFPIVFIESDAFVKSDEAIRITKAYLLTIIGIVNSDILELGFLDKSSVVVGTCPIEKASHSIVVNDRISIKIPFWFVRGLEEFFWVTFWGTSAHHGGNILKLFLQFQLTKAEFEKGKHYQLIKNKFITLVKRPQRLGEIKIEN